MTTIEQLKEKREQVIRMNDKLAATGNKNELLTQRVNELLAEEWQLRFKCAQEGVNHEQVK